MVCGQAMTHGMSVPVIYMTRCWSSTTARLAGTFWCVLSHGVSSQELY
jgi:hypothetical protein